MWLIPRGYGYDSFRSWPARKWCRNHVGCGSQANASTSPAARIPGAWSAEFSGQEEWIVVETCLLGFKMNARTFWATLSYELWNVDTA